MVTEFFVTFGSKIGSGLIWRGIVATWSAVAPRMKKNQQVRYRQSLKDQIVAMPFIYRDLELNAVDDFVDVELASIDSRTHLVQRNAADRQDTSYRAGVNTGKWWRLVDNRKVILLGEAGIGKTTIFRHLILSLLSPTGNLEIFPASEKLIPVYVPLKAIDAGAASPIVRYIIGSDSFFGDGGKKSNLFKLARQRRLVLFFDGYDEIPHVGGTATVTSELELLYSDVPTLNSQRVRPDLEELYNELRLCRCLLSTRREFFITYMPRLGHNTRRIATTGIGAQRQVLVSRIFNRYRRIAPTTFEGRLNEELFLQQLALRANYAIAQISHNPLFLTALCFTYVQHVLADKSPEETWRKGTYDLILECIRLLVIDIDKNKVRGLSDDQRSALLNRRSAYPSQKLGLLVKLAGKTYEENVSLMTLEWMTSIARSHFMLNLAAEGHEEILQGLRTQDATANIVLQLIFSGIFIPYPQHGRTVYDFPHRRFREVLAVQFFNNQAGCLELCRRCEEEGINSLLLYFVQNTAYWEQICLALGAASVSSGSQSTIQETLVECLEHGPSQDAIGRVVCDVIRCLAQHPASQNAWLRKELIDQVPQTAIEWLRELFRESVETRDGWRAAVAIPPILRLIGHSECVDLIGVVFDEPQPADLLSWQLCRFCIEIAQGGRLDTFFSKFVLSLFGSATVDPLQSDDFLILLKVAWVGHVTRVQRSLELASVKTFPRYETELKRFFDQLSKASAELAKEVVHTREGAPDALMLKFRKLQTPISPRAWR